MTTITNADRIQVSPDRVTVWVFGLDGSTVGRFSKVFGMDVHTTVTAQLAGAKECLKCTHEPPSQADWEEFCELMQEHYGVTVDPSLLSFETLKPPKLSEAQKRVMKWVGKGWRTEPGPGSTVYVNGKRICNTDTMMTLSRLNLVEKDDIGCWSATPQGKAVTKVLEL